MIRVMHVITGVSTGGAEIMLYRLLCAMDVGAFQHYVVSMIAPGRVGTRILKQGVPVQTLRMRPGVPDPRALLLLAGHCHQFRPHVIHSWMYHANLLVSLVPGLRRRVPIIWGIHHSDLRPEYSKRMTRLTARVCALLSHWVPARIVCCAESARQAHLRLGYAARKMIVIPNGFDAVPLAPPLTADERLYKELRFPREAPVVCLIARFHPQKDHLTFIRAAAIVRSRCPSARFVLCGDGVTWGNQQLSRWIDEEQLRDRFYLLGHREDVRRIIAGSVVVASSSGGEAFPMVLGEAMAAGVPCVATDTGDVRLLIGDAGIVVPAQDAKGLAEGMLTMLDMPEELRTEMGLRAREHIQRHFALPDIVARYQDVYLSVSDMGRRYQDVGASSRHGRRAL